MNFGKSLAKKLKKTGGFTLIEMLIVVAIIAILVAVSIPMVTSSLDKARTATDDANERAAKAAALLTFMDTEPIPSTTQYYCYDAKAGTVAPTTGADTCGSAPEEYGQGSSDGASGTRDGHVHVTVTVDGETSVKWIS